MLLLISISVFATVCLFVIGLTMKGERALISERISSLKLTIEQDVEMLNPELTVPFGRRVVSPWLEKISNLFSKLLPANYASTIGMKLVRAGNPWHLKASEFIGIKALVFILFAAGGFGLVSMTEMSTLHQVMTVILAVVIGYALPETILEQRIRERKRLILRSLADCLDLLVVSAEAGLGFDAAIAKVVERAQGPLAVEFDRVLRDMSIGRSRMEALRAMSDRIDLPEVTTFVAAIHQADLLGVSIAQVLRVQAESMRIQRNLRARETAAKLPVKLLFPLVFFIFPAIFIVLLGPGAIRIFQAFGSM